MDKPCPVGRLERGSRPLRMQAGGKEDFVGVDIADAGNQAAVHQEGFERRLASGCQGQQRFGREIRPQQLQQKNFCKVKKN